MNNPTTVQQVARPNFVSTPLTKTYWNAAGNGDLLLQKCNTCDHLQHYPRSICTRCWSTDLAWQAASGFGHVWTFTVVGIPGHAAWQKDVPFVLALVELEEGPRLMTNIVACDPDSVRCGQRVKLHPYRGEDDNQTLLQFVPATNDQ